MYFIAMQQTAIPRTYARPLNAVANIGRKYSYLILLNKISKTTTNNVKLN